MSHKTLKTIHCIIISCLLIFVYFLYEKAKRDTRRYHEFLNQGGKMKEPLRYTLSLDFPFKDPLPEMVLDKDGDWVDYYEAKMLLNKFTFRPIDTLGETHKHVLLLYKGDIYEGWLDDTEEDPGWCVIKYGDNMILGKPTHWMPKPELPKG